MCTLGLHFVFNPILLGAGIDEEEVAGLTEAIAGASCPEEAARLGRRAQRCRPHLVRPDWDTAKLAVMQAALHAKVTWHLTPFQSSFGLIELAGQGLHLAGHKQQLES